MNERRGQRDCMEENEGKMEERKGLLKNKRNWKNWQQGKRSKWRKQ